MYLNTEHRDIDYPNVQLLFSDFSRNDEAELTKYLENAGFNDEIKQEYYKINSQSYMVLLRVANLKPYSTGRIELQSKDPRQYTKIIAGYFSDPRDLDVFIKVYNLYHNFAQTDPLKSIGAKIFEIKIQACMKFPFASREYRDCFVRHLSTTLYHPVGTCKMGDPGRPDTVVDPTLRVKGVQGLRVIDASVMPFVTRGNTNAPTIMIGEKGADLIKETWLTKSNRTILNKMDYFRNQFIF